MSHRSLMHKLRLILLCMLLLCLLLLPLAGALATETVVSPTKPSPSTASECLLLTPAEASYLAGHRTLTVAYGKPWEPLFQFSAKDQPSGISIKILNHLAELANITLIYVPLETSDHYDILCCEPNSLSLSTAGVILSDPFLTLPLVMVTKDDTPSGNTLAVDKGFQENSLLNSANYQITYYPGARDCLDAVLNETESAAVINSYAAEDLLQSSHYAGLTSKRLEGVSESACFGVHSNADPQLLNILNALVKHVTTSEMTDFIITSVFENQPINLSTIADQMPPDVMLVLVCMAIFLLLLLLIVGLHDLRTHKARTRTAEIATFLDYANRANDDVWEVDVSTFERWRYRVEHNTIVRMPISTLSPEVIERFVHPDDQATVLAHISQYAHADFLETHAQERFECRVLYGEAYRWVRVVFQSMFQSREHPNSLMVYMMDVDDAIRAEERKSAELQTALTLAEEANRAKGRFTAYISHEIRSPLNAILGYLALARTSIGKPERLMDCFVKSEYAANHLLGLINDVLDLGSINSGKLRMAQNSFDLRALLDTIAAIYNAQAKSKGVLYTVEAVSLPERYLIGDDLRIKQVLVNLVSNAVKFTPAGGHVTLTATQEAIENSRVLMRFQVADNGIGMTEAFQTKIFEVYEQQDTSIAANFGGSGLGLAIAKRLISLMDGTITVQSAPGLGETFIVEIPFPVDTSKRNLIQTQPDSHTHFAGKRLLLVEDNDMNMEIATELLKQEGGFTIETASNGRIALERFTQSTKGYFDAILMDVRMPVMDGYEATRAIRSSAHPDAAHVPIIAMTADAFDEDVRIAMEAGMNGHIAKPIDIHHVLVTLANILSTERL